MNEIAERIGLCEHCLTDETRYCHSDCHLYSKYRGTTEQKAIDDAERDEAVYNLLMLKLDDEKKLWLEKAWKWVEDACSKRPITADELYILKQSFKHTMEE